MTESYHLIEMLISLRNHLTFTSQYKKLFKVLAVLYSISVIVRKFSIAKVALKAFLL